MKPDPLRRERVSCVIRLCNRGIERTCPAFAGAIGRLTRLGENPAMAESLEERRPMVRRARAEIRRHAPAFTPAKS